jgi:RecA/RadA recombinase
MQERNTLVINLFGSPGAGKSTMAAKIYAHLKESGYLCELTVEYAKEMVWQESWKVLRNQIYMFGKQHHRIWRLKGKVDIIVTDSPFLLGIVYGHDSDNFRNLILEEHKKTWSLNIFLKREHQFEKEGRVHSEEQTKEIDNKILDILGKLDQMYHVITPGDSGFKKIIETIEKEFNKVNLCPDCDGTGKDNNDDEGIYDCLTCEGNGSLT